MKIGDKVKTIHGVGEIASADLPLDHRTKRWVVRLTEPNEKGRGWVQLFKSDPAYFPNELTLVKADA